MKLEYREEAIRDLEWFKQYYSTVFPAGAKNARRRQVSIRSSLLLHPEIGHVLSDNASVRELVIPRTPFSFIYFIAEQQVIVLRVLDNRAQRPAAFQL